MWIYRDKEIKKHSMLNPDCMYIVYQITFEDGTKYIGKKAVRAVRRLKPTKKQLKIRKNYVRKELKNIPFLMYQGSSEGTVDKIPIKKEILYQCKDSRTATYIEAALQFYYNVLFDDGYLNENILGKFYDNALNGLIEEK